jgi:hypothetical protein
MPPNLDEFIPGERLPVIIDVYVNIDFLCLACALLDFSTPFPSLERPIKLVRQYPRRTCIDQGMSNTPS